MKELSLLMFFIALLFGMSVLIRSLIPGKNPDGSAFYIPSRGMFNIIWGSIFYIGYGILIYPDVQIAFILGIADGLLIFYALFLMQIKKFLLNPQKKGSAILRRYLEKQLDRCQKNDSGNKAYSFRKCMKILGLAPYTQPDSEQIAQRLQKLEELLQSGKLSHPYLPELLQKLNQTLSH